MLPSHWLQQATQFHLRLGMEETTGSLQDQEGWGGGGRAQKLVLLSSSRNHAPFHCRSPLVSTCLGLTFQLAWAQGFLAGPRLLLGTRLPCAQGGADVPQVLWAVLPPRQRPGPDAAPVEQQRGEGSHGWWAEALLLRGPHFGCWFLETRSPSIGRTGRACVCSSSICFWNLLIMASATLRCCLARAGVCVSLP